jgi:hypothetical protein
MNDKKLYMYSGVAIAMAIVAYFVITRKAKQKSGEAKVEETVVTNTGSEITLDQAVLPAQLSVIFNLPLREAVKKIGNKNVFTKVPNVNARKGANVNNGFVNNSYGVIAEKNINVGKVIALAEDLNGAKNSDGRIYKWVKVNLTQDARKSINASPKESLLNSVVGSIPATGNAFAYFREDTITLN